MQVSFIIPLFNCLAHTQAALRTLQATLPAGLAHEIIFVDDASTDGTRDWLASLPPPCRALHHETNLGFAAACNRGASAATGNLLFFLNNDLLFLPGWFEPMRDLLARDYSGIIGNTQRRAATGAVDHTGIHFDAKGKPAHLTDRPLLDRLRGWRDVPALTGACIALRSSTWLRLGGFDAGFRNGCEDVDLCLRARLIGLRNRVSLRSVVQHHVSASTGRKLREEHNARRLALRWGPQIATHAARAWSRAHIATLWDRSCLFDHPLARAALATAVTGRRNLPVHTQVESTLRRELQHWAHALDGAPATFEPPVIHPPRL